MADRLSRRIRTRALIGVLVALAVAGIGTAGLLHVRAEAALDRALLAAAYGEAHPWSDERWTHPSLSSPVEVEVWSPHHPLVRDEEAHRADRGEPVRLTRAGQRVLVLLVGAPGALEHRAPHQIVVAHADAVELRDLLPFGAAWMVMGLGVVVVIGFFLDRVLVREMAPLERAAEELAAVTGLAAHTRVAPAGVVEVDQVVDAVNALLERLERAFESQASFTAQAAHELRTPVTVLLGELDLALRRDREPEAYRVALRQAKAGATALHERVEALMALARVDAGQAESGRRLERLSAVVLAAIEQERPTIEQQGGELSVDLGFDPELELHTGLMTIAVANLLRNAAHHAPGTRVHVTTDEASSGVVLTVQDEGPGLDPTDHERVFDRFHRARPRRRGLGLGLPLAREIVRRHGGELTLSNASPTGCVVTTVLPLG